MFGLDPWRIGHGYIGCLWLVCGYFGIEFSHDGDHEQHAASRNGEGGYDDRFAAATAAAGGTVGIIIPPSIIFIVYGFLLNLSISELFIAGIVPGVLMVVGMQLACFIIAQRNGWGHLIAINMVRIIKTALGAWLGFIAIVYVLYGIYFFSPTEAAGMTVGFVVIVAIISLVVSRLSGMSDLSDDGKDWERRNYIQMMVVKGFTPWALHHVAVSANYRHIGPIDRNFDCDAANAVHSGC